MTYKRRSKKDDWIRKPEDLSSIEIDESMLDIWQHEVMDYWGDLAIRAGRRTGKSFTMGKKIAKFLIKNKGVHLLISASSERQAMFLYEKVLFELKFSTEKNIFAENPTMRRTVLKNGAELYCLPVGLDGNLIRGLDLDVWAPDEHSFTNSKVSTAIEPMLWTSKKKRGMGWTWALSTPFGKQGKFWEMFNKDINPNFKTWHISALDCDRIPKEELEKFRKTHTKVEYAQEVLGEFVDEVSCLFNLDLLRSCFKKDVIETDDRVLGVDVARFGGDSNAFIEADFIDEKIKIPFAETTDRVSIYATFKKIIEMDILRNFKKIIIDDAGVGGGLVDFLIKELKSKILGINNASRSIDSDGSRRKLMKEDLYSYALTEMEAGNVEIKETNLELFESLSSMQFTYEGDDLKIFGRNSHLAEAFVRAIWGKKAKGLNMFVRCF